MSFSNKNIDLDGLVDHDMFIQELDQYVGAQASTRQNRDVCPEFSDPIDYRDHLPLKNSTNFNVKQGMKFINKDLMSKPRFQPYNLPSTSNKNTFNHKQSSSYQSVVLTENQQHHFVNHGTNDKAIKSSYKMNSSYNNNMEQKIPFNVSKNKFISARPNFIMESANMSAREEAKRQRKNLPGSRNRHLIGSVDQILRWHKSVKNSDLCVIYEVNGILECIRKQLNKQLLFIRGESGHILQAVFYEIDRPMPECKEKSPIMVTGRMIGFRKMQVFDIVALNHEDYQAIQRLSFLSQRAINEALEN